MAEYEELELLAAIENQEIHEENVRFLRKTYQYRNGFDMTDQHFIRNFRLSKDLTRYLINLVRPYVGERTRASSLSVETKVLITLNFLATGCYQLPVGSNEYMSVSQSSVSRCIHEVVEALNQPELFNQYVKFPNNLQELQELRQQFYEKFRMPGIIGCVDCTHIAIVPPPQNDENRPEYIYVNRKNYHSINTQLICDTSLKILHVNARFPGSTNDAHIWINSNIEPVLRNIYNRGHIGYFLLGDSGYSLRPWLLTPLANPQGRAEDMYNERHKTVRSSIERCNGVLKMRFRCLLKHRFLHYHPTMCSKIINACVVLHNMCIEANIPLDENNHDNIEDYSLFNNNFNNVEEINAGNLDLQAGRQMQRRIINFYR